MAGSLADMPGVYLRPGDRVVIVADPIGIQRAGLVGLRGTVQTISPVSEAPFWVRLDLPLSMLHPLDAGRSVWFKTSQIRPLNIVELIGDLAARA